MSLLPGDYLNIYHAAANGRKARDIAAASGVTTHAAVIRLTRLEGAGYIRRNADGLYQQDAPFDPLEVNRLISHGWTK